MSEQSKERMRILVVDDDWDFLALMRAWLIRKYDVVCLADGERLLNEMKDIEPDMVILDVNMPDQDGFTLCRRIRAHRKFSYTPVLFLTASRADGDFVKNMEVGGNAFINKPITNKNLHSAINRLLLSCSMA
jgi:DNA-binding response OmpR family regulator